MKRLHVHLKVDDLERSIGFYSALFGLDPTRREPDYAKWRLDEPAANVSISTRRAGPVGVDHVGVEVDSDDDLHEMAGRLSAAKAALIEEPNTSCCYARSNKYWATSPEGAIWELFHTFGASPSYHGDRPQMGFAKEPAASLASPCCGPV
jgi:catechol 2,3-dioxygenase-like lactoylglutathione lyase family enzyme